MLLQTNSYVVPKEKRAEHARLLRRFRQALTRLGCTDFEVYEQVGTNWSADQSGGRFVQIMRFRDRKHQLAVQAAEREDPVAQALVAEFCELINFPYQQENNLFAVGYYTALMGPANSRGTHPDEPQDASAAASVPPSAPAWAGEPVHPFAEANPDLSRLAQEFIRSAPPAEEIRAARGSNGESLISPMESNNSETADTQTTPVEQSPSANGDDKYEFQIPQYAAAWNEEDEPSAAAEPASINEVVPSLDELLDLEIGQSSAAQGPAGPPELGDDSDSAGIGHVLQASLADDELDIALPAELIDPAELDSYSANDDEPRLLRGDPIDQQPRRG